MRQAGAGRAGLPPSRCSCHAPGSQARHPRPLLPAPHSCASPRRLWAGPSFNRWLGRGLWAGPGVSPVLRPAPSAQCRPQVRKAGLGFLQRRGQPGQRPLSPWSREAAACSQGVRRPGPGRPHRRQPRGGRRVRPGTRPCCWWSRGCSACSRCCGSCCCSPRKPGQPPPPRAPACRGDACASRCTRARR